mmetsp:Transcript_21763/g.51655  ORF Transcript_21763/g.51655 Transcript_21763/m.51655 type:complete len:142 (+) Transcript_21763:81-506(+)
MPLSPPSGSSRNATVALSLSKDFGSRLVLEVFGAGGAVWGFSEVLGLRTETVASRRLWRILALATAVVFGIRWARQLAKALVLALERERRGAGTSRSGGNGNHYLSLRELMPVGDEELGMATSGDSSSDESTALFPRSPTA